MREDVVVIGGGFAGLSAAITLADEGYKVTLLEKKRILGGRAYSFVDPAIQEPVDNGQHLLMSCYHHTLEMLKKLKTDHLLSVQPALQVHYLDKKHRSFELSSSPEAGFLGMLSAFLNAQFLSLKDKVLTLFFLPLYLKKMNQPHLTVAQWCALAKQPRKTQKYFWEPLCLAALNGTPEKASAQLLYRVIEEAFLKTSGLDGLIFPKAGLTDLTGEAALKYLSSRNGRIQTQQSVKKLHFNQEAIQRVECVNGECFTPKAVISALPPKALYKLIQSTPFQSQFLPLQHCRTSPILSIHLWLKKPLTPKPFISLIDSPLQWIFNRQKIWGLPPSEPYFYTLIVSGAKNWETASHADIEAMALKELKQFFPSFSAAILLRTKIIKEPDATLSPAPDMLECRLNQKTSIKNFFLAGDWTNTQLPGTIESAVYSGQLAAQYCIEYLNKELFHERIEYSL